MRRPTALTDRRLLSFPYLEHVVQQVKPKVFFLSFFKARYSMYGVSLGSRLRSGKLYALWRVN